MLRNLVRNFTGLAVVALTLNAGAHAQDAALSCHLRAIDRDRAGNTHNLQLDGAGGSLCVQGGPMTVRLVVRQTAIAAALSLLAAYQVSYRSLVQLDEQRDGIFQGSISHVIARLLEGYNYVIKQEGANVEVVVFNKKGGQAVPSPTIAQAQASQERGPAQNSRHR